MELAALGVRAGLAATELLRPLDNLREALFRRDPGAAPLPADSSQALPRGSCLLALLPAASSLVRLAIAPGAAQALELPVPRSQLELLIAAARASRAAGAIPDPRAPTPAEQSLAAALYGGLDGPCASATELWLWVEAPLAALDLSALPLPPPLADHAALGLVTSLDRLLTAEPRWPPPETLFISGAEVRGEDGDAVVTLPAAAAERESLRAALGGNPLELSGPQLTPSALLARLATTRLLHAAVHGAAGSPEGGGSLQLSGELGRLRSDEIAQAHLPQDARVVLSACHAASAESGLSRAFARAGALEIASAAGSVDDAAAARWGRRLLSRARPRALVRAGQSRGPPRAARRSAARLVCRHQVAATSTGAAHAQEHERKSLRKKVSAISSSTPAWSSSPARR